METDPQEQVLARLAAHPYGDQDENGVDLSLLRENLKLTPRERLAKLQHILMTIPRRVGDEGLLLDAGLEGWDELLLARDHMAQLELRGVQACEGENIYHGALTDD